MTPDEAEDVTPSRPGGDGRATFVLGRPRRVDFGPAVELRDPFDAVLRLHQHPRDRRPTRLVVSLLDLHDRHASLVRAAKRVRPDVEVFLADCDGRTGLLAELVLQGADGIVEADGSFRRFGQAPDQAAPGRPHPAARGWHGPATEARDMSDAAPVGDEEEPILSPAELAALLRDDDEPG